MIPREDAEFAGLCYTQSISFEYLRRAFTPISRCMISAQTFQSWIRSAGFTAFGDCGTIVFQKKRSSCLDHVLPPIVCELGLYYSVKKRSLAKVGRCIVKESSKWLDVQEWKIGKSFARCKKTSSPPSIVVVKSGAKQQEFIAAEYWHHGRPRGDSVHQESRSSVYADRQMTKRMTFS